MMKLLKVETTNGETVYLNPSFITSIKPSKDGQTRIDHFGWSSFVGNNLVCALTPETIESVVRRIEEINQ